MYGEIGIFGEVGETGAAVPGTEGCHSGIDKRCVAVFQLEDVLSALEGEGGYAAGKGTA